LYYLIVQVNIDTIYYRVHYLYSERQLEQAY
jgi:hypothetical protein